MNTQLKKATINELGSILREDYHLDLDPSDLEKLAYSLVGYFRISLTEYEAKFGNNPPSLIDIKNEHLHSHKQIK